MNTESRIDEWNTLAGSEFLLDGYITCGEERKITVGGCNYYLQRFQGEHEDEYTLKKDNKVYLFQNGIMKMAWEEDEDKSEILLDLRMAVSLLSKRLMKFGIRKTFVV